MTLREWIMAEAPRGSIRLTPVAEQVFGFGRRHGVARVKLTRAFLLSEHDKQRVLQAIKEAAE
jgi:hypothetical protein